MPTTAPALPASFTRRKALILSQLSVPAAQYADRSPKGSIDEGVRDLIEGINAREGWVTTSSCAGRVSVFVEGAKRRKGGAREVWSGGQGGERGAGGEAFEQEDGKCRGEDEGDGDGDGEIGKGNVRREVKLAEAGGRWLFVSHERVDAATLQGEGVLSLLGLRRMGDVIGAGKQFTEERLVHFKFEPMILHVLTASLSHAQAILKAALQAGFRESGALNVAYAGSEAPTPMVAVRSTGLSLDSVIGRLGDDGEGISIVSETYLEGLVAIANERFEENSQRIIRFQDLLLSSNKASESEWEDASVRRERKRAEGLQKSRELKDHSLTPAQVTESVKV